MLSTADNTAGEAALEVLVGRAVKRDRTARGLTLTQLSEISGVSAAMISRIERGQVSPSLTTLDALARALGVPVVNFLAATAGFTDTSFVRAGEGVEIRREGETSAHFFRLIGQAQSDNVRLRVYQVELEDPDHGEPLLSHPGVEFVHVVKGALIYRCGGARFEMREGDSLTFETRTSHAPEKLLTPRVTVLTAIAAPAD